MKIMKFVCVPLLAALSAWASGPYGADNGWAISNSGTVYLTEDAAKQMVAAGTGWIRVEMRLIPGHTSWDEQMLGYYDEAVNNARNAGLQVLLLVDYTSWPGNQSAWEENNAEVAGGNGRNDYVVGFAWQALRTIVDHFRDRVYYYEIWNEPNAWTQSYGKGGSFLYPSNYAWMLAESWTVVHLDLHSDAMLFSGGVFGHNIGGSYNYDKAGGKYLDDTYAAGIQYGPFKRMKEQYGTYPLDGIGQHIYIHQGGVLPAGSFRLYLDYVRQAYTKYEGADTRKETFITEFGWQTHAVSETVQDQNLVTAFQEMDQTPYVHMATWFQWHDGPSAGLYYGVLDSNNNPKLAFPDYQRYETFEGRFADRTVSRPIADYFAAAGPVAMGNPEDLGRGAFVFAAGNGFGQDSRFGTRGTLTVYSGPAGTYEVLAVHGIRCIYEKRGGAERLGLPTGEEYREGEVYRQNFEHGRVVVPEAALPLIQRACGGR